MPHHRIYSPDLARHLPEGGSTAEITIDGDEAHHAVAVKRISVGEHVELLNGQGIVAEATVIDAAKRRLTVAVTVVRRHSRPALRLIIAAACPKGPRADAMVEGLSQVGADAFIPLCVRRSVAVPSESKVGRWRKVAAVESMKQCGRPWLMEIAEVASVEDVVRRAVERNAILLMADSTGESVAPAKDAREIVLLIGPEGGFDESEVNAATSAGAALLRLGPYVLRTETAAVVAAALGRNMTARESSPDMR